MKTHSTELCRVGFGLCLAAVLVTDASAATSFSNSLTGFSGDSTLPATQAAVGAAGFNFFSTAGLDSEFTMDPTIVFDSGGAHFGSLYGGDGGRNYVRTNDSDYATVNFVAEITVERDNNGQQAFIGLGAGNTALFGVPDWSTLFSSTFVTPEDGSLTRWRSANDANEWTGDDPPSSVTAAGTHRVRMEFDRVAKTMTYSIDLDYAGGPFTSDATAVTDLNHIDCPSGCGNPEMPISADFFGSDGWPNEPSRIYFGGDDSVIFTDFTVAVSDEPGQDGDFDGDDDVDGRDFLVWQRGESPDPLSAGDLALWQANYGMGALAGISAVPEPSGVTLLTLGVIAAILLRRQA